MLFLNTWENAQLSTDHLSCLLFWSYLEYYSVINTDVYEEKTTFIYFYSILKY